ncbi:GNAT family N-acetyltransferase [bacterium]|nr:GNAT family N-acetyltransferase [bacterium]
MRIRQAQHEDVNAICVIDHIAQNDEQRRVFISTSVHAGTACVAEIDREIAGYVVLEHSFFGRGFIAMLVVDARHRRAGIGTALVRHAEGLCRSDRLFVSTNESNKIMQALLEKLGYTCSGVVGDLDPGDREVFFSREVRGRGAR